MFRCNNHSRAFLLILGLLATTMTLSLERREIPEYQTFGVPASASYPAEVDALVDDLKSAWRDQDTARFVALHAEDVEWINAYGRMFRGSQPLADFLEHRLFPAFDAEVSRQEIDNMKAISTRFINENAAVVHLYTDGQRGASRAEGELLRRTHFHLVLHRTEAGWKIVHSAIMDAR